MRLGSDDGAQRKVGGQVREGEEERLGDIREGSGRGQGRKEEKRVGIEVGTRCQEEEKRGPPRPSEMTNASGMNCPVCPWVEAPGFLAL